MVDCAGDCLRCPSITSAGGGDVQMGPLVKVTNGTLLSLQVASSPAVMQMVESRSLRFFRDVS